MRPTQMVMRVSSMLWLSSLSLSLLAGCPDRPIGAVVPLQAKTETKNLDAVPTKDVDILFVVDNSGSMSEEQSSLLANFGKFMDVLATIEGGVPNLHIGVTTSNLGQSATDGVAAGAFGAGCVSKGDDGGLRASSLVTGRFIIDEEGAAGARTRNYSGTLADAFSSLANVGIDGCGIEQHLGAAKRALENPANVGFLRPNAKLAVIFIADEDDCSLSHKALFEGETNGAVVNFRCTKEGIECEGGGDLSVLGLRTGCMPKINSPYLAEVDSYVDYLKSLKAKPDTDVIVAGIVGDPDPVEIIKDAGGYPALKPSCTYGSQYAYPAVRTADFLAQFPLSVRETICGADLSSALVQIGVLLKRSIGERCFAGTVADLDADAPGLQPDCSVSDMQVLANGTQTELATIPQCDGSGAIPCWRIVADETNCFYTETKLALEIDRGGVIPPSDIRVRASCVTTEDDGPVI